MTYTVFVHTNHKQWLGALVSAYSMRRNSKHPERFDVEIIRHADYPFFGEFEGKPYLRDGVYRTWRNDDLQSFTPLRFMPPELMDYQGRAVVVDPDVFAVGDVYELLSRDMEGKALLCRMRSGLKKVEGCHATSVMLLDCTKLSHWQVEAQFRQMFTFERDYRSWICLKLEEPDTIGFFEHEWNDFDRLTEHTKMLHNTKRRTQPWKSGLPVDFIPAEQYRLFPPLGWAMRLRRRLFGDYAFLGSYKSHPDPRQEQLFFGLLKECLEQKIVSEELVRQEMSQNHVRHDAFDVIDRTPRLAKGPIAAAAPAAASSL
ncbi:MAG: hypothetical protein ACFCBW_11055 [Candidatus Competibacterales bacterium]